MQTPGEFVREQVSTVREKVDRVAGSVAESVVEATNASTSNVTAVGSQVGNYIREQRSAAQVSLRELARTAGVSNPYLSQVERGLRKPSAEILASIARGLKISAERSTSRRGSSTGAPGTRTPSRRSARTTRCPSGTRPCCWSSTRPTSASTAQPLPSPHPTAPAAPPHPPSRPTKESA